MIEVSQKRREKGSIPDESRSLTCKKVFSYEEDNNDIYEEVMKDRFINFMNGKSHTFLTVGGRR
jgi:hypothetical protein